MTKIVRCGECGSKDIAKQNVKGRYFPFLSFPKVKLQKDLELSVCNECQNIIMMKGDSVKLDQGLEESIVGQSQHYIEKIKNRMGWKQNEMADCIGFTPVYLSEIKKGKKILEFRTFNYFKILSECPGAIELVLEGDPKYVKAETYSQKKDSEKLKSYKPSQLVGDDYGMAA